MSTLLSPNQDRSYPRRTTPQKEAMGIGTAPAIAIPFRKYAATIDTASADTVCRSLGMVNATGDAKDAGDYVASVLPYIDATLPTNSQDTMESLPAFAGYVKLGGGRDTVQLSFYGRHAVKATGAEVSSYIPARCEVMLLGVREIPKGDGTYATKIVYLGNVVVTLAATGTTAPAGYPVTGRLCDTITIDEDKTIGATMEVTSQPGTPAGNWSELSVDTSGCSGLIFVAHTAQAYPTDSWTTLNSNNCLGIGLVKAEV